MKLLQRVGLTGLCAMFLIVVLGCTQPADQLATFDGGSISVDDLNQFLLGLPEPSREVAKDQTQEEWVEVNLRRLTVERILDRESAENPDPVAAEARRLWLVSIALGKLVVQQLEAEWQPDQKAVEERVAQLEASTKPQTLYAFEHIYFALHRAQSPAEEADIRQRADAVAKEARSGADFATLASTHSESADAAQGGRVSFVKLSDLEKESAQALEAMSEGEVSPVVETRTGLHIFHLVRRVETRSRSEEEVRKVAIENVRSRDFPGAKERFIEELRQETPIDLTAESWTIGSWVLDAATLDTLKSRLRGSDEDKERMIVTNFVLAEEAVQRGLMTEAIEKAVAKQAHIADLQERFNARRQAYIDGLGVDVLRPVYDAQPSAFSEPEQAHVQLIFIPKGDEPFSSQTEAERHAAALRAGRDFAELAREVSKGPAAADGGDLGWLQPSEWYSLGPAVHDAIRSAEVGEIVGPVFCTDRLLTAVRAALLGGFAIIRVVERKPERPRPFEEVVEDVRRAYVRNNMSEVARAVNDRILDGAGFKITRIPSPEEFLQ